MGQNIRTSLAQAVAEELRVPVSMIKMVMGDTDLTPFDAGTFGSRSTPQMGTQLRKAAAAAREILVGLAAEQWRMERAAIRIQNGLATNVNNGQTFDFAKLVKGEKLVHVIPDDIGLKPAKDWSVCGVSKAKVNGRDFVTGKHEYTSDIVRPGLLFGKVVRPSAFNAVLVSADTKEAEGVTGVRVIRDANFIGVTAPDQQSAGRAAATIKAVWKAPAQTSSAELFDHLRKTAINEQGRRGDSGAETGSIVAGLAAADKKLESTYNVAYIAHVPLEPRAAVAEWNGNKLTVWTGTQRPFGVKGELAEALRMAPENIRVLVPDTGSGYGGKHTGDAAIEAARLAKAVERPVKVVWSREEEFSWAYFRPAGVIDIKSGIRNDGKLTAWEFHNYNSGPAGIQGKYEIPNQKIQFHPADSPLRQGSYRGLAGTANHFARESHIDELADEIKMDPFELRLKNITDERLRAVLEAAATRFAWNKSRPVANHGFGLACGFEKGGYLATCTEVSVDPATGKPKIIRVVEAFECGAIVNPEQLKNQVEGAVVMAIGGALFESVKFENGKIVNNRFSQYRVPRFSDVPSVEVVLLDRKDIPSSGAGETPIMALAPAVGNAVFRATGKRIRSLPMF